MITLMNGSSTIALNPLTMLNKIFLTVLLIISTDSREIEDNYQTDDNCRISIEYKTGDFKEPQPLILSSEKKDTNFLYPNDKNGYINIRPSRKINLACPGKKNHLQGIKGIINKREIQIKCIKKKIFTVNDDNSIIFNITSVTCKYYPENIARIMSTKCFNNSTYVEVGFSLENTFLRTIKLCYNSNNSLTYYTKFELTKNIGHSPSNYPRPRRWLSGEFYSGFDMDYLYKIKTQFDTVTMTVGSEELAKKYITAGTARYLSRGHMVAKADFIYGNAQRSTFWYINAAPQWQTFNGGNWNTLEGNVRSFAEKRLLNLHVYTGVHGQMKLIDINNNLVPVYLFTNSTHRSIPVPQYYWKIIYDPVRKLGTAFVGLNDPYALEINDDMFLCTDIANKIKWLTWDANSIKKGVSYACTVDDLRKVIPSIPQLEVYGVLK
ncbi:hypothetical protein PV326_000481 [Microctonus aethiopoides]|nr:hypothetical protein PV326_000481 [Microctonus aethiopoides]